MPITRGQMERQLRMGGGIMQVAPRQGALLGGLKKAVKGIAKGIGSFLKSDAGKLGLLTLGGFGLAGKGPLKFLEGGLGNFGLGELLTKKAADVTLGDTLKVGAIGTVLGGVLSTLEPEEKEEIIQKRNLGALESKLTQAYQNLGYDEAEIPGLVANDMSEYTAGAGGYAEGGRIGFGGGSDMGTVADSKGNVGPSKGGYQGGGTGPVERPGGSGNGGPSGPPSITSAPPPEVKKSLFKKIRENPIFKTVTPFVNPAVFGMSQVPTKVQQAMGIGSLLKNIGNMIFTPAGAAELSEDERRIQEEINRKSGYGDTINKVLSDGTVIAGGGVTGTIPDLSNPDVLNKIAIDLGLPTQKQGTFVKKDVATPETASAIKEIQDYKRKGVGGDPELKLSAPEIIDFYGTDGQYKGLGADEVQSIYDMVSLPGQNRFMVAGGGRMGYAMGDTAEQNAIQASGIMDLPLNQNPAGITELDLRESGGFIPPVGVKEKADDIPAMLSNNEFVFTADAVRGMGDGNVNLGAQRMYDMMKKLENGGRV